MLKLTNEQWEHRNIEVCVQLQAQATNQNSGPWFLHHPATPSLLSSRLNSNRRIDTIHRWPMERSIDESRSCCPQRPGRIRHGSKALKKVGLKNGCLPKARVRLFQQAAKVGYEAPAVSQIRLDRQVQSRSESLWLVASNKYPDPLRIF